MAMTPNGHGELREQVELYAIDALAPEDRRQFEAHLATCDECRALVGSWMGTVNGLSQAVPQHDPPPGLRARVLAAVGAPDLARGAAPPSSSNASAPWFAMAAALVAATGLAVYTATLRSRVGDLERRLAQAIARADASERKIADAQRATAVAESQIAVLTAPDLRRIDLAGRPIAPQSSGRAFWSRAHGLVFTASNLPPLPAGRTYQLWVLTAQPAPISAGVFKPDNGGAAAAMFQTPVDIPPPVGMAVTIEPEGGVAAPTGAMYLAAP